MLTSDILAAIRREVVDTVTEFDDAIIDYVNQAVREAEESHNYRHMEATLTATTVENTRVLIAKPDRWKETREAPYITTNDGARLEIDWGASSSDMVRMYGVSTTLDTGQPQFLYETETDLQVYPLPSGNSDYPDGDWRMTANYWRFSVDLDEEDDQVTNWWSINKPWFVIYQTAALILTGIRDVENAAVKAQLAAGILRRAKGKDKRSRLPERMTLSISKAAYKPGLRPRRGGYRGGGYLP